MNLVIGHGLIDFGKGCKPSDTGLDLEILRAFLVGSTDAALHDATAAVMVDAGIAEVKSICARLKKENAKFECPSLADFETTVKKDNEKLLKRNEK